MHIFLFVIQAYTVRVTVVYMQYNTVTLCDV